MVDLDISIDNFNKLVSDPEFDLIILKVINK